MAFNVKNNAILLTRGDTGTLDVNVNYKADKPYGKGEPYEIGDGDTLKLTLRRNACSPIALQKVVRGTKTIRIEPEDTANLGFGEYSYDVELTLANGDVCTVITPHPFVIGEETTY